MILKRKGPRARVDLSFRRVIPLLGFVFAVAWASHALAALPNVIYRQEYGTVLWVSAEEATRNGELQEKYFRPSTIQALQKIEKLNREMGVGRTEGMLPNDPRLKRGDDAPYLDEDLCGVMNIIFDHSENYKKRDDFESLVKYSLDVIEGKVVEITQGFFGGNPGSLLKVDIAGSHRKSGAYAPLSSIYVAYRYAVFTVGSNFYCYKDPRFNYRPRIGDRVFLFPSQEPRDRHARLIIPEREEIIAQRTDGSFFAEEEIAQDELLVGVESFEDLRRRIHLILKLEGKGK